MRRSWGSDWKNVLSDHGFSASPAWTIVAHPLASLVPLSKENQMYLGWIDMLLMLALHGVSEGLVDALLAGGYRDTNAKDLFRLEAYGLRSDWIASMSRLEGPPSFRELIRLRRYGVGVHDVDGWVEAGIEDLDIEDLLRLYAHGFKVADALRKAKLRSLRTRSILTPGSSVNVLAALRASRIFVTC